MVDYKDHVLRAWAMALVALGLVSSATGQTITEYPSLAAQTCEPDATTMCLNASRFRVTADWRKADGTTGQGQAVPRTSDSGYFWFFNPANIELVTKVLNACTVNEHYWVFAAGLTNVEVTLRVVDTYTGSLKTYFNPLSTPYQPVQDTSAFAACQDPGPLSADLNLAPSTPPCPGLTEVTGIYQDGKGTYGDRVYWGDTPDGVDLRINPLCSANRQFNALLPSAALALLTGPIAPCETDLGDLNMIQLKVPDLLDAPTGVVGKPSLSPEYPKGNSVYFYFLVDSNHDGQFGFGDDGYNFVWQSGIYLTRTEYSDRTVYDLTTDLTSPDAELIQGIANGGTSKGVFCVPLRLTATQLK
jgi:hypothetical protein